MSQKQQLLKEVDGALYDLKSLKKNVDYTRSQAKHLEHLQLHRGGRTLFDTLGDFVDMFKMAKAAYADKAILDQAKNEETKADDIMSKLSETKLFINDSLTNTSPKNEKEKNIMEEFMGVEDDAAMFSFIDAHGNVISEERNQEEVFTFDDALDDFETVIHNTSEEEMIYHDEWEEIEEYRNQQR